MVRIDDVVLDRRPGLARAAAWSPPAGATGGSYAANGMSIRVFVSSGYIPNQAVSQSWAEFFAGLPQSSDAASLVVFFATPTEMTDFCSEDAVACYDPAADIITVPVITSDADHEGHRLLGHELWHRLGGHHH